MPITWFAAYSTYVGYAILIFLGRFRDLVGGFFNERAAPQKPPKGIAPVSAAQCRAAMPSHTTPPREQHRCQHQRLIRASQPASIAAALTAAAPAASTTSTSTSTSTA